MTRSRTHRRQPENMRSRGGFTMVEILMVVVIISILLALLLPAIYGALRTARNAAVSSEINQIAQALASFKTNYGAYPPSRVLLAENGLFPTGLGQQVNGDPNDITIGALAQRSLVALRQFFPRVVFGTQQVPAQILNSNGTFWYDFNGNGVMDANYYILEGHECLVFFLGGIPSMDPQTHTFGLNGFGKDPTNPFTNNIASDPNNNGHPNAMYGVNRQSPLFEFATSRLFLDPNNLTNNGASPGIPGYYDSVGAGPPGTTTSTINFYVYFAAYGNGLYDPNDVNFAGTQLGSVAPPGGGLFEMDDNSQFPMGLQFQYSQQPFFSSAPNPYTSTLSVTQTGTVTFQNANTFQLFSSGIDGLYGVGGQYIPSTASASSASNGLPLDAVHTLSAGVPSADPTIRLRERDNVTNFKAGTLQ